MESLTLERREGFVSLRSRRDDERTGKERELLR